MLEKIEARIKELRAERDRFVQQANAQIGAYNGGIAELEALLKPAPGDADDTAEDGPGECA